MRINILLNCDYYIIILQYYEYLMLFVWMINFLERDKLGVVQYCVLVVMYIV